MLAQFHPPSNIDAEHFFAGDHRDLRHHPGGAVERGERVHLVPVPGERDHLPPRPHHIPRHRVLRVGLLQGMRAGVDILQH